MDLGGLAYSLGRRALNAYFRQPTRRNRSGRRGRGRRQGGMARSGARTPFRPPTRSLMQGTFSGTIRQFYTVNAKGVYHRDLPVASLLNDAYAALKTQFAEVQVKAIRVYFVPNATTSVSGNYTMALIDADNLPSKDLTYSQVLASPGSTVRKMWQGVGCHWKWTEPSDAEYKATNDDHVICTTYIATANNAAEILGDLTVDASITLRSDGALLGRPLDRMILENDWSSQDVESAYELLTSRRSVEEYVMA